MEYIAIALSGVSLLVAVLTLAAVLRGRASADIGQLHLKLSDFERQLETLRRELIEESRATRQETQQGVQSSVKALGELMAEAQRQSAAQLSQRQETLQSTVTDMLSRVDKRFESFSLQSEQKLDNIRATIQNRLSAMQEDNTQKLEQMRQTVDERLQKTLEERLAKSFAAVSERLEQVHKGLGEMQAIASGVGDLKKVLSNVKTRGVLGEIQLGAILEEILSPEQYDANVATKPGSPNFVEYAVKLPGDENGSVYLPIDAKFPADAYTQLVDAYDRGISAEIDAAGAALESRIKRFAKEIHDKYVDPPHTTDFAILFLPFEGLYAEAVRRGLVEVLQRDSKVNIAGPTTMAALLNSLQMGFKTLAIQKRSGEVWNVLGAVKTEFDKFGTALATTQQRLEQANSELDKLVGVRTRQIQRRLKDVTSLPELQSSAIVGTLELEDGEN